MDSMTSAMHDNDKMTLVVAVPTCCVTQNPSSKIAPFLIHLRGRHIMQQISHYACCTDSPCEVRSQT